MSSVGKLLDELRAGGRLDSTGRFTMDRLEAKTKMRRFQLDDPLRYVLELVRSAVVLGAETIRFEIDADDMWMTFSGPPLTLVDFDLLYNSIFSESPEPRSVARRNLALGINAALALNPKHIRIVSGDGKSGAVMLIRGAEEEFHADQEPLSETRIHVKQRFFQVSSDRFFINLFGNLPEERYLRESCRFCTVPIDLEGNTISQGYRLDGLSAVVEFNHSRFRGAMGFDEQSGHGELVLVQHGVVVVRSRHDSLLAGVLAVVESDDFRLSVSRNEVVADDLYHAAVALAVQGQLRVIDRLCRENASASPQIHLVLTRMLTRFAQHQLTPTQFAEEIEWCDKNPGWGAHLAWPILQTIDGRSLSLRDLQREFEVHGTVFYSTVAAASPLEIPQQVVLAKEAGQRALLNSLFGSARTKSKTRRVKRDALRLNNIALWRKRAARPELPSGNYLVKRRIADNQTRGEVGFHPSRSGPPEIEILVDGALLCSLTSDMGLIGIHVVIEGPFKPNKTCDAVRRENNLADGLLRVGEALIGLFDTLAALTLDGPNRDLQRASCIAFLENASRGDFLEAWLCSFGFSDRTARARVNRFSGDTHSLEQLVRPAADSDHPPHALCSLPLFEGADRTLHSLDALRDAEELGWIEPAAGHFDRLPPGVLILRVDQAERTLLDRLLGPGWGTDFEPRLWELKREQRFLGRPCQPARFNTWLSGELTLVSNVYYRGVSGQLAIARQPRRCGLITTQLLLQRRRVGEVFLRFPGARLMAIVNYDKLQLTRDLSSVVADENLAVVAEAVADGLPRLLGKLTPEIAGYQSARALLTRLASSIFPSGVFRQWYEHLHRCFSAADAEQQYQRTLELNSRGLFSELETHLSSMLAFDSKGGVSELEQKLSSTPERADVVGGLDWLNLLFPLKPGESLGFGERVFRLLPAVADNLMFRGRPPASLTALFERLERDGILRYSTLQSGEKPVLWLAPSELRLLQRLLGEDRLLENSEWERDRRLHQAFKRRPVLRRLTLVGRSPLVTSRLAHERFFGELGLKSNYRGDQRFSTVTLCKQRRVIETTNWDYPSLVAIVNDEQLVLSPDYLRIEQDPAKTEREQACLVLLPELYEAFAAAWPTLSKEQQQTAWLHVLDALIERKKQQSESPFTEPPWSALAEHAGFVGHRGSESLSRFSFADVITYLQEVESLDVVDEEAGRGEPLESWRIVLFLDASQQTRLATLVGPLNDYNEGWELELQVQRILAGAELLGTPPPGSLVQLPFDVGELAGELYLPLESAADPTALSVRFGYYGRLVEERSVSHQLPCAGVVQFAAGSKNRVVHRTVLPAQIHQLQPFVFELYTLLARSFRDALYRDRPQSQTAARHYLRLATTRLASLGSSATTDARSDQLSELVSILRELPLFELGDGRHVSARILEREHPSLSQRFSRDRKDPEASSRKAKSNPFGSVWKQTGTRVIAATETEHRAAVGELPESIPERGVLEAVREALALIRKHNESLLTDSLLGRLAIGRGAVDRIATFRGATTVISERHPLFLNARKNYRNDPISVAFLVSALYTAINSHLEEITDFDEQRFLLLQSELILEAEAP